MLWGGARSLTSKTSWSESRTARDERTDRYLVWKVSLGVGRINGTLVLWAHWSEVWTDWVKSRARWTEGRTDW
jgi:hypothetical protein